MKKEKSTSFIRTKVVLILFGVSCSVLLLVLLNGFFVLAGIEQPEPLFIKQVDMLGREWRVTNPAVGKNWFYRRTGESMVKRPRYQRFTVRKPDDMFRIFVIGESAAMGVPLDDNATWARMLEYILNRRASGKSVQVINCGLTASTVSIYPAFIREIRTYQPDLFILYAGHNEFYGIRDPGWFRGTRLVRLFSRMTSHGKKVTDKNTLMELLMENEYPPGGTAEEKVMRRFELDLDRCLIAAGNVPVMVYLLTSNEAGLAPFQSSVGNASPADIQQLRRHILTVEESAPNIDSADNKALLSREPSFPKHAGLQHALGLCDAQLGNTRQAIRRFKQAIDTDLIPFRARSWVNRILKQTVEKFQSKPVFYCETESAFRAATADSLIGNRFFLDHVHPTIAGNYIIAVQGFKAISGFRKFESFFSGKEMPSLAEISSQLNISEMDAYIGYKRIERLVGRPPFSTALTGKLTIQRVRRRLSTLFSGFDAVTQDSLKTWEATGKEAHTVRMQKYLSMGDYKSALTEAKSAVWADPESGAAHYNLSQLLMEFQFPDAAREHVVESIALGYMGRRTRKMLLRLHVPFQVPEGNPAE